jgi:hypothetical protein
MKDTMPEEVQVLEEIVSVAEGDNSSGGEE